MAIAGLGRVDAGMAKKLKILAISYLYPNSVHADYGIFVHNRLQSVNRLCGVVVINPIPWFPFSSILSRYKGLQDIPVMEIIDGIKIYHPRFFIIPRFFKFFDALSFFGAVVRLLTKHRGELTFDLIDLHWTYPDLLTGILLKKILKRKLLVTVRGKEALNLRVDNKAGPMSSSGPSGYSKEYSLRYIMTQFFLKKADTVITLSRELKDLCKEMGVRESHISVITNGINKSRFYYVPQNEARLKLKVDPDKKIILAVGSLIYGKGFDRLINLLPGLGAQHKNIELVIIGSEGPAGNYSKELIALSRKNQVKDQVIFIGQVPNESLRLWYSAADLFCLSSRGEGSPNVLYEALACGCPCVATNVGSVPDIMDEENLGVVVPNTDTSLSAGIKKAFSRNYNRQYIQKKMEEYSWDSCGQKVVQEYNRLVGN